MILRRSFTSGLAFTALARAARSAPPPPLLQWQNGYTIQKLTYWIVFLGPLFVSTDPSCLLPGDKTSIENALAALTSDSLLNKVLLQYFNNQMVTATPLNSKVYADPPWDQWQVRVFQNDLRKVTKQLANKNLFPAGVDFTNFAVLFVLPPGTILSDHDTEDNAHGAAPDPNNDEDDRFARYGNSLRSGMARLLCQRWMPSARRMRCSQ